MKSLAQIVQESYNTFNLGDVCIIQDNYKSNKIKIWLGKIVNFDKLNRQIVVKDFSNAYLFNYNGTECANGSKLLFTKEQSLDKIKQALNDKELKFNGKIFVSIKNKQDLLKGYKELIEKNKIV